MCGASYHTGRHSATHVTAIIKLLHLPVVNMAMCCSTRPLLLPNFQLHVQAVFITSDLHSYMYIFNGILPAHYTNQLNDKLKMQAGFVPQVMKS